MLDVLVSPDPQGRIVVDDPFDARADILTVLIDVGFRDDGADRYDLFGRVCRGRNCGAQGYGNGGHRQNGTAQDTKSRDTDFRRCVSNLHKTGIPPWVTVDAIADSPACLRVSSRTPFSVFNTNTLAIASPIRP
jgi:hypothetical protein